MLNRNHQLHNPKLYTVETNLFEMKRRQENNEHHSFVKEAFLYHQAPICVGFATLRPKLTVTRL